MLQKRLILLGLLIFIFSYTSKQKQDLFDNFSCTTSKTIDILSQEEFETDRLFLKPKTSQDNPILAEFLLDEEVTKYVSSVPNMRFKTKEEALDVLQKSWDEHSWVIKLKDNTIIGCFSFEISGIENNTDYKNVDIGYFIGKKFWKQGFAREACTLLALKLFQCSDVKVLNICVYEENTNSIKLVKTILDFIKTRCDEKVVQSERKFFSEYKDKKYSIYRFGIEKV